jgi:hypothetical protein
MFVMVGTLATGTALAPEIICHCPSDRGYIYGSILCFLECHLPYSTAICLHNQSFICHALTISALTWSLIAALAKM